MRPASSCCACAQAAAASASPRCSLSPVANVVRNPRRRRRKQEEKISSSSSWSTMMSSPSTSIDLGSFSPRATSLGFAGPRARDTRAFATSGERGEASGGAQLGSSAPRITSARRRVGRTAKRASNDMSKRFVRRASSPSAAPLVSSGGDASSLPAPPSPSASNSSSTSSRDVSASAASAERAGAGASAIFGGAAIRSSNNNSGGDGVALSPSAAKATAATAAAATAAATSPVSSLFPPGNGDSSNSNSSDDGGGGDSSDTTTAEPSEPDLFDPLAPRPPLVFGSLFRDAEEELRALSFSLNALAVAAAAAAAAGGIAAHSLEAAVAAAHAAADAAASAVSGGMHDPIALESIKVFHLFGGRLDVVSGSTAASLASVLGHPWRAFAEINEAHPLRVASVVSGAVYALGDLTAQSYEGRGLRDVDAARTLRSSAAGALAHGPLSCVFYESLDRFVVLSAAFDNGDAWFAPLFKVLVDQTAWAAAWNALYLSILGLSRLESPAAVAAAVAASSFDVVRAGWRLWPLVHLITYVFIPRECRLLWVDAVDLGWVTVLAAYAVSQKRGAAEKQRRARARS